MNPLSLLSGPWGYVAAALAGAAVAGALAWQVATWKGESDVAIVQHQLDECGKAREKGRADLSEKTVALLSSSIQSALAADRDALGAAQARERALADFESRVRSLPVSHACVSSPAIRELLSSVRNEAGAGNSNANSLPRAPANDVSRQPRSFTRP